jgi:hypothetical protein
MPIVAVNPRKELSEFYPPPYNFLAPRLMQRRKGMGQSSTQLTQTGISLATTGASTGAAVAGASSGALIGGLTVGAAIPIFGAIAAALVPLLTKIFSGCGQTCVLSSDAANQIEQILQQNVNAYFASPRTSADQQAALNNFDTAWAQLEQYCGQPSLGQAGQNCIDDREAGACTWKTSGCSLSTGTPPVWSCGAAGSGDQCWNWFVGYRDPIANDTMPAQQAAAQAQTAASGSNAPSSTGLSVAGISLSSLPTWLIPALLVGGGILIFAGGD